MPINLNKGDEVKMKKVVKSIIAAALISIMTASTAFAGTWKANTFQTPEAYETEYQSGQVSLRTYTGFSDDRTQATLVNTDWKYQKDDGSYAVSEWIQDESGKYYYISSSGTTAQGFGSNIDGGNYFFEPSDGHMIADSIIGVESLGGWDVNYTVNADGTWDFLPWDGFDINNYQRSYYMYFDESGKMVSSGEIPGGSVVNGDVANVIKGIDENGVPFITVGNSRYIAVKSSSSDTTCIDLQGVDGIKAKSAYHEFYTVYERQK